ncbi:MAG: Dyp-type peroxidase family [Acidimicrobiaceae bacterium]|nr:Dyp-type peroxidase family [Acidimicrobiaceae bacterium]
MQPQSGIFAFGTTEHCYVELDLAPGADAGSLVSALAALHGPDSPLVATSAVVALRPELWASVAPDAAPPAVRSFAPIQAGAYSMPATQHDAWIWCAGPSRDVVFDSASGAIHSLAARATVATEVTGWVHERNRDLTGFIDGTENPPAIEAPGVALVPAGPGVGASVLLVQQWEHLDSFAALSVEEQEKVIGRTKSDSIQLEGAAMPADSHVSRNVVEEDGKELAIFRRNTAWGGPTRHGTMFVGFCGSQHPLQVMLERMAGVPDGVRDALTRHTVPLTGAYYVVPALDALARLLGEC